MEWANLLLQLLRGISPDPVPTTLLYDYEVRDEAAFFKGIPSPRVPKDMGELAGDILDRKAVHFDAAK